jgi:hypothetical protein
VKHVEPVRETPQPADHPPLRAAGITIGSLGLVTFATGLYFGHRADTLGAEVTSACRVRCDWGTWKSKDIEGHSDARLATVLDVVGAVGLASGAVVYYLGMREDVTIVPTGSGAIAAWSGTW